MLHSMVSPGLEIYTKVPHNYIRFYKNLVCGVLLVQYGLYKNLRKVPGNLTMLGFVLVLVFHVVLVVLLTWQRR